MDAELTLDKAVNQVRQAEAIKKQQIGSGQARLVAGVENPGMIERGAQLSVGSAKRKSLNRERRHCRRMLLEDQAQSQRTKRTEPE